MDLRLRSRFFQGADQFPARGVFLLIAAELDGFQVLHTRDGIQIRPDFALRDIGQIQLCLVQVAVFAQELTVIGKLQIRPALPEPPQAGRRKPVLIAAEIDRLQPRQVCQVLQRLFQIRILQPGQIQLMGIVLRDRPVRKGDGVAGLDQRMPCRPVGEFGVTAAPREVRGTQLLEAVQLLQIFRRHHGGDALNVVPDGPAGELNLRRAAAQGDCRKNRQQQEAAPGHRFCGGFHSFRPCHFCLLPSGRPLRRPESAYIPPPDRSGAPPRGGPPASGSKAPSPP